MGPLQGIRVVELAGIGPAPFTATLLADMGADVLRIDRTGPVDLGLPREVEPRYNVLNRGRPSLAVDLKRAEGCELVLDLVGGSNALIEGFRPGVMERLGLGPAPCLARNPRLVYGRITGFGQDGPLSARAGHDINYIALSGVLAAIGRRGEPPAIPLNLVGDFGGGAMFLAFGVVCALLSARATGRGQVVDAAMIDGAAYLSGMVQGLISAGAWTEQRGGNALDGGAPWYGVYATADGGYMAVGAIEARFWSELLAGLGLDPATTPAQHDRARWPELGSLLARTFETRSRGEWEQVFSGRDACVTPVLTFTEAARHPHNVARGTFREPDGVLQPAPAPRYSETRPGPGSPPRAAGVGGAEALAAWGVASGRVAALQASGVIGREPAGERAE